MRLSQASSSTATVRHQLQLGAAEPVTQGHQQHTAAASHGQQHLHVFWAQAKLQCCCYWAVRAWLKQPVTYSQPTAHKPSE
jgi:hypothetical protein